ncbi:hypothetical protein ACXN5S_05415 [Pseudoroseicyclus sp. H15]
MKITLHLGAHRTGTTTLQRALAASGRPLRAAGLTVWLPGQTRRGGWLSGLDGRPEEGAEAAGRDATGKLRAELARLEGERQRLLISEENLPGTMRNNLRCRSLYPDVTAWLGRLGPALEGHEVSLGLAIRPLDEYWASALANLVARGQPAADDEALEAIGRSVRGWRHVIREAAGALPGTSVTVWPAAAFAPRPEAQLALLAGEAFAGALADAGGRVHNARPSLAELRVAPGGAGLPEGEGPWQPFSTAQVEALRDVYAADLDWLRGGAEGLARCVEEPATEGMMP